jgi:hypothetical protein
MSRLLIALLLSLTSLSLAHANLLRNPAFQDDWATHLFETKNHHWNYSSEYQNRRDYNPDGWWCKGSWVWENADAEPGKRRLVLQGPNASVTQRVNWVMVNDERQLTGFPDGGGFPDVITQRSKNPLALVRDLALRVTLKGTDVPEDAGKIEVGWHPWGGMSVADPMGNPAKPLTAASAPVPAGTYEKTVEVTLPTNQWLQAAQDAAEKDPNEKESVEKDGLQLPVTASVTLMYTGETGRVEVRRAELIPVEYDYTNLLPNGNFEEMTGGYPTGWCRPQEYTYFAPRGYYRFNTWHNQGFPQRGPVTLDTFVVHDGNNSLKMIVPPGDQQYVASDPISLNQKEPRMIEVSAWVKTDHLNALNIEATDEKGRRLDGCIFVHKAPVSIGTDDWRLIRQVFRPREPVQSIKLLLCARGVNGYTLDDTGFQPQANVVGTIWWDDVAVFELESTLQELNARGLHPAVIVDKLADLPRVTALDLGERKLGENVLTAIMHDPGRRRWALRLELTSPSGKKTVFTSPFVQPGKDGTALVSLPYRLTEPCSAAYSEYTGYLSVSDREGYAYQGTALWFSTWTHPIDLEIGAAYLLPEQSQLVRMNLGLSSRSMPYLGAVKLELLRRGSGQVLKTWTVDATPAAIAAQREKIPVELREDFSNLLLTDLDLSFLPLQQFNDPQRNWLLRATLLRTDGKPIEWAPPVLSTPFCRLAHDPPQPPITSTTIKNNLLYVNGQPWMPWGACYGHIPVYDGPADSGKYRDLHNLQGWTYYDGFTAAPYNRHRNDMNTLRYVESYRAVTDPKHVEELQAKWAKDNLYCSTFFIVPNPVWSLDELIKKTGGQEKLAEYIKFTKDDAMVVSTSAGVEEAFGIFHKATPEQLAGMGDAVKYLREQTGKPVMVAHGGGWNRFEFEKVPYYDIYDPETEPWFPAPLHVDLWPLVQGQDKVIWLRPQMYESVTFERWRYHVFVEMMRGCRGWQIAHGPGDQSTFRGLHAEMEFMKPIIYAQDMGPTISIEPWLEHWSRRYNGKTYLAAAVTHPLRFGSVEWNDEQGGRTASSSLSGERKPLYFDGVQYIPRLIEAEKTRGAKLVQWVKLDGKDLPENLVLMMKTDGRWNAAAAWGAFDMDWLRNDKGRAYGFLTSFYKNSSGFLGWDDEMVKKSLAYMPEKAENLGALPAAGEWVKLEVPLERIGATGMIDGVACLHEGGNVRWGHTSIVFADGSEQILIGDSLVLPPSQLAKTKIAIPGLKAGAKVRVLFEDREITAGDGYFIDDFRGEDLYQRFGGPSGYGIGPVALHVYELP